MKKKGAKKKAARKTAKRKTAKKAAKKKTVKRPAAKKPPNWNPKRKRKILRLTITGGVVSNQHARAKKNTAANDPDRVSWRSTDVRYVLTFNTPAPGDANPWPFTPNRTPPRIIVQAKKTAGPFTIRAAAVEAGIGNGYGYSVVPPPAPPAPLPTPEVIPEP